MQKQGKDKKNKNGMGHIVEGHIRISGKGIGYLEEYDAQPREAEVEIDPTFLRTALHGDRVRVLLHPIVRGRDRRTGEVVEICERARKGFSGVLVNKNGFMYVLPGDRHMYASILIPKENLMGATVGQKVFAEIVSWENARENPIGKITHILGMHGEHDAEMRAIALEQGFEHGFKAAIEEEAATLARLFDGEKESKKRKDMRDRVAFTIDPADAKDFDDALSYKELPDGNIEIGVHIADVSSFVKEGGAIDQEAYDRATSVYLVDRTIPMLPEILSNNLCSLVPDEDRLTMSAVFTMNQDGDIVDEWYGETIIRSKKRFSYEEAQSVLEKKQGPHYRELAALNMRAKQLREERRRAGALMIDAPEIKFNLDEKGVPLGVTIKIHHETNHLIEEFMLLANRKVTEWVEKRFKKNERVFVYRVHDKPDGDKMGNLAFFLNGLGYQVHSQGGVIPSRILNSILEKAAGTPLDETLDNMITRTMAKAVYTTKNIGHYGLSFKAYTHFTSPIRRYPDLMVHRLLKRYTTGGRPDMKKLPDLEKKCAHASQREREAQEAERSSVKFKQVEYMQARLGKVFDGIITGVSEWGIFVAEKESRAEGMIRMRDMGGDYFELDEKNMRIIGKKTKKIFALGDTVRVKVAATDTTRRTIDYIFV